MPIIRKPENVLDIGSDRVESETSDESFDRAAFARRAIDLVMPRRTTVAICEGALRMRVESGRVWGHPRSGEGPQWWALLAIPARASRRAIAVAVVQLARGPRAYALDVLMGEAEAETEVVEPPTPAEPSAA
jgi:hypothetical protein